MPHCSIHRCGIQKADRQPFNLGVGEPGYLDRCKGKFLFYIFITRLMERESKKGDIACGTKPTNTNGPAPAVLLQLCVCVRVRHIIQQLLLIWFNVCWSPVTHAFYVYMSCQTVGLPTGMAFRNSHLLTHARTHARTNNTHTQKHARQKLDERYFATCAVLMACRRLTLGRVSDAKMGARAEIPCLSQWLKEIFRCMLKGCRTVPPPLVSVKHC